MPLIIDQPSLVPLPRRFGWGCVTALFWMAWFYLWMPLITLLAWGLDVYNAYSTMRGVQEVVELKRLLALYSIIVAAMGSCLLLWALSEFMRHRHKRRRTTPMPVQPQDVADHTGLPVRTIVACQYAARLVAYHDDHGHLLGADLPVDALFGDQADGESTHEAASTPLRAADSRVAG